MKQYFGKNVLVTGSCGTVGAALVEQLVELGTNNVICIDNNESELFFQLEKYKDSGVVSGFLADIRDKNALNLRFKDVDIVLHTAALKHVGLCENSPAQAIATNIDGTQNVIDAALENKVERVIFTSSDKAVNPTNVMGTSKLMGERLMTAAYEAQNKIKKSTSQENDTIFASTRFGNVLGSRGSVVPLFKQQIQSGGPITLTDNQMTRFVMTLEEAATLVLESVWIAEGGEVLVTKMPVARIEDIAKIMKEQLSVDRNVEIIQVVAKPGEKMYEELMNDEEVRRAYEFGDFFVIRSAFSNSKAEIDNSFLSDCQQPDRPYNSQEEPALRYEELKSYFMERNILA